MFRLQCSTGMRRCGTWGPKPQDNKHELEKIKDSDLLQGIGVPNREFIGEYLYVGAHHERGSESKHVTAQNLFVLWVRWRCQRQ